MSTHRLLFSFAHPDDESFGSGGTIARYASEGADVYLICATNGDVGTVSPELLNGYKSVSELRLAELECAAHKLGFKHIFKLGYKDSGMMNSETSQDPGCLWQASREEVTRRVVEVIRQVKPQVIVTFNRYGGYGHPDHIAIQQATTDAFKLAGDASYATPGYAPYQAQKLYYTGLPTMLLRLNLLMLRARRQDPRRIGKNKDIDYLAILENIEPIHTKVDVRNHILTWEEANACHSSQLGGGFPRIPISLRKAIAGSQGFTRVYPTPRYNRVDEYDLFAGVQPDE